MTEDNYFVTTPELEPKMRELLHGVKEAQTNPSKLRFDLIAPDAEAGLAAVLTHGAIKYGPHNWEKGLSWSEPIAALRRHLSAFMLGGAYDPDSGLPHVDHIMANAMFLAAMFRRRPDLNDVDPNLTPPLTDEELPF